MIFLRVAIANIDLIYLYLQYGSYCNSSSNCAVNVLLKASMANMVGFDRIPANIEIQDETSDVMLMSLLAMQILMIIIRIYIIRQNKMVDNSLVSASDYTIIVRNLPNQQDTIQDIRKEISSLFKSIINQYLKSKKMDDKMCHNSKYIETTSFIYNLD